MKLPRINIKTSPTIALLCFMLALGVFVLSRHRDTITQASLADKALQLYIQQTKTDRLQKEILGLRSQRQMLISQRQAAYKKADSLAHDAQIRIALLVDQLKNHLHDTIIADYADPDDHLKFFLLWSDPQGHPVDHPK